MVKINVQAPVDFTRVCTVIFAHSIFIIVFIFPHTNPHIAYVLYGWPIIISHHLIVIKQAGVCFEKHSLETFPKQRYLNIYIGCSLRHLQHDWLVETEFVNYMCFFRKHLKHPCFTNQPIMLKLT